MTTKTSTELVFDLFNRMNPALQHPLTPTNVTLSAPAVNDNNAVTKNTKTTISAVAGQGYSGSTTVYYNRVSLADIVATGSNQFLLTTQKKASDILPLFNAAFNTNLIIDDIVEEDLPAAAANGTITYTLQAAANSPAFLASVVVKLVPADIPLSQAITTTDMTGLTVADVTAA